MKSKIIKSLINNKKKVLSIIAALAIATGGSESAVYAFDRGEHKIQYASVPQAVKTTLGKHVAGAKIQSVYVDKDHGTSEYEIRLTNGIKAEINANGAWEEFSTTNASLPLSLLPANAAKYISAKYANAKVVKIEKESYGYDVELSGHVKLKFDVMGNLMRVKK